MNGINDFDLIYTEYQPRIYRYLTQLVGEKEAEDLTQEVFIRVGRALESFSNQAKISTWIYQIATNSAIDKMRSPSFKMRNLAIYSGEEVQPANQFCSDAPPTTEEQLIRKEMNECIQAYVDFLPENYRAVLVLSEMEGFKNSEIADILGISLSTVKIRLHRAKEKLKQELTANCLFYRTDCNQLACEPKGPFRKAIKPLPKQKR